MSDKKTEIEEILEVSKLREIGKGEQGQYIKLADIKRTKTILTRLALKYNGLVVTKDNYKTLGKEAEQELRNSRYALQNIFKANNSFLNKIKREERKLYEELIALIEPQEKRLKGELGKLEREERERKEREDREEKERKDKIEEALRSIELGLEKAFINAEDWGDLEGYDDFLTGLKEEFPKFEEEEFRAKRLHAIYSAKRKDLVVKIEECIKVKAQQEEIKKRIAQSEAQRAELARLRKAHLQDAGFTFKDGSIYGYGEKREESWVLGLDEVSWMKYLGHVKQLKEGLINIDILKSEEELDILVSWGEMKDIYKGLGGDVGRFELKLGEVPTSEQIAELAEATRVLHKSRKEGVQDGVKQEVKPYGDDLLKTLEKMSKHIDRRTFKYKESKSILSNLSSRVLGVINEVLGDVYNQ